MSLFPWGRLFWKFLVFFSLAQMTVVFGLGIAIWATTQGGPDGDRLASASAPEMAAPGLVDRFVGGMSPPPPPPRLMARPGAQGFPPPPPDPRQPKVAFPLIHLMAGGLVSVIFAALLAAYIARPIQRLRFALREAAEGRLAPGVAREMGNRRDELADLGLEFDRMAGHLDQLVRGQRHLLHDVSHELRSPLARLTAIVGIARQQPERIDEYLARLETEATRMDRLLAQLLTLSRLESGMTEEVPEDVDLREVIADVVDDAMPEAERTGCVVEQTGAGIEAAQPAWVHGDAEMLHRVLDNLVRNALKHAAEGKWIGISLCARDNDLVVQVEDRGPGLRMTDLERVFEPFYRGPKTQAAGQDGHGLGLAIAKRIVEKLGGTISASNRDHAVGGGLCVTVVLPRRRPSSAT